MKFDRLIGTQWFCRLVCMMKNIAICLLWLLTIRTVGAQSQYTQPGVDVLHYRFALSLTDANNQIQGEATIRFRRRGASTAPVWFDLVGIKSDTARYGMRVRDVRQKGGQPIAFSHKNNRIVLPAIAPSDSAVQEVIIRYAGVPAKGLIISKNKFGERTFFGDNWPNNARYWLPVIDHPSDKATCEFLVTAPAHYRVIANGKLIAEKQLSATSRLTHWQETAPIPTKVMVIGAARFAVEEVDVVNGIAVQSWLYPKDRTKGVVDYRPAKSMLQWFIDKIGPYSYEKLANVESTTMFGGMENASCIFYTERAIVGKKDLDMEGLLAHEIAHQWFGNSATEAAWPHIWLSEGFATYFSALYLEHAYGRDTLNRILNTNKGQVFRFAAMRPSGAVVDTVTQDLMGLLNPNSYQKGGWILHMLRYELGDEVFWQGIRTYYQRYRNANARTEDFRAVMEQVSGQSLGTFFNQWVYQPGYPDIAWSWRFDEASRQLIISVKQQQTNGPVFVLPLVFRIQETTDPTLRQSARVLMNQPTQEFVLPVNQKPTNVVLDPDNGLLMKSTLK